MSLLLEILRQSWLVLLDAAPYLILGFLIAGLLHAFLPPGTVAAHLGRGRFAPILKASLWGIPLPLCSCGVLPAALGLRSKGASKGAVFSFLVSTPETGVDSIAVSYGLLGPVLTVARPLAALGTAFLAGVLELWFGKEEKVPAPKADFASIATRRGLAASVKEGLAFAFGDFYRGVVPWLALGLVAAGAVTALVPDGWIEAHLAGPWAMPVALAAGIPLYVCATASTPIAAALLAKGLSPGAALVFLLSGPATNAASITVLARTFGVAATARYLGAIAAGSLAAGFALDALYPTLGAGLALPAPEAAESPLLGIACAALLAAAYVRLLLLARREGRGFT